MKTPRDVDGKTLIKKLEIYGYKVSRQVGSHVRLTTTIKGVHHITIPNHSPLKIGTLSSILNEVAMHHESTKADVIKHLFS